jgi:hypothetical protein
MTESFKNKLQDFAPEPPKGAWEGVVSRLNDSPLFADKLTAFEATPPASVWQAITQQLDQKENEPLIRIIRPNRYVAAALLLIMAGMAYFTLFREQPAPSIATAQGVSPLPMQDLNQTTVQPIKPAGAEVPVQPISVGKNDVVAQRLPKGQSALAHLSAEPDHHIPEPVLKFADESDEKSFIPTYAFANRRVILNPAAERYMVYSDGQGNAMRLPRRMFDYVACMTNELDCKKRIAQLRNRAAAITMNTDFSGVLEMLAKLEENK